MPMVGWPMRRASGTVARARSGRRLGGFWDLGEGIKGWGGGGKGVESLLTALSILSLEHCIDAHRLPLI